MKPCKAILIFFIMILFITACAQKPASDNNKDTVDNPTAIETQEKARISNNSTIEEYQSNLVFIKKSGENWLAVDDRGIVHEVSHETMQLYPGTICENAVITEISDSEYKVSFDYPFTIPSHVYTLESEYNEAPYKYADFLLQNLVYNGNPGIAITDYNLTNVEVIKEYNTGRMDVAMNFDVKPTKDGFCWGEPNDDGMVKDEDFSFTLYGADNYWLTLDSLPQSLGAKGERCKSPVTLYKPSGIQKVIFEDKEWSYYSDGIMLPQTGELEAADLTEYIGTINRVNRDTGISEELYKGGRNTNYYYFADYADKLYILSSSWIPFSSGSPSYFGVLDLNTQHFKRLVEGTVVRGTVVEDKGYVFADDKLIEINLSTSGLSTICQLPVLPDYTYGGINVLRVINDKMYIAIFDAIDIAAVEYVVDLITGNCSTVN